MAQSCKNFWADFSNLGFFGAMVNVLGRLSAEKPVSKYLFGGYISTEW